MSNTNPYGICTWQGKMIVRALHLDHDGILAFARNDPDLAAFLGEIPPASSPTVTPTATLTATPTSTVTSTPSATPRPPEPTATPLPPTRTPLPAPAVERILFAPGTTQATIDGYLPDGGRALYVMGVAAGQFVEVSATVGTMGQGLRFSIVGADGFMVKPMGRPISDPRRAGPDRRSVRGSGHPARDAGGPV